MVEVDVGQVVGQDEMQRLGGVVEGRQERGREGPDLDDVAK